MLLSCFSPMLWKDTTTLKWMAYLIFSCCINFSWNKDGVAYLSICNLYWVPLLKRFYSSMGRTADTSRVTFLKFFLWLTVQPSGKLVKQKSSAKFLKQKEGTCCKGLASGSSEILDKLQVLLVSPGTWSSHEYFIRL